MRYAVYVGMLGYTRISSLCVYNEDTRAFDDLTPAEGRRLINQKQLKGVICKKVDDEFVFVCDKEGFNQQNIPVKSACKFRPLLNDYPGVDINSMYTVVRVLDTDYRGRLYEVVSNKCCRVKITEKNLRELAEITNIAGVWITEDEIKVADGIKYEDRRAASKEQAVEAVIETMTEEPIIDDIGDTEIVGSEGYDQDVEIVEDSVAETVEEETPVGEQPSSTIKGSQGKKSSKTTKKR